MVTQTFHRFPELPIEIREMIWVAAIHPRFVHIRPGHNSGRPPHSTVVLPKPDYLYSTSPVPPLLHTSRESRRTLKSNGYKLAFAVSHCDSPRPRWPRIWFNFNCDILYIDLKWPWRPYDDFHTRPNRHYMVYCRLEDEQRIKTVALASNIRNSLESLVENGVTIAEMFRNMENLLIVEHQCVKDINSPREIGHLHNQGTNEDLLGYLECDNSDALGCGTAPETDVFYKYFPQIRQYMRDTGSWGRNFFHDRAQDLQERIMENNWYHWRALSVTNNVITHFEPKRRRAPLTVRFISIVSGRLAQGILKNREEFWERVQATEDWEAEFGPSGLLGYESDELKYFDEAHTDGNEFPTIL